MNLNLLTQRITVKKVTGRNDAGDETFSTTARTMRARVQPGRDRHETAIEHTHVVYAEGTIDADDRVWFPGDDVKDDTKARRPVSVTTMQHPTQGSAGTKALF